MPRRKSGAGAPRRRPAAGPVRRSCIAFAVLACCGCQTVMWRSNWRPPHSFIVPPEPEGAHGRRQALAAVLGAGAGAFEGAGAPAHAELPRLLVKSLKRYAEPLQHAADELVFDVKPAMQAGNWTRVSQLFAGGAYSKSNADIIAPVVGVVNGNEDFLPGAGDAPEKLDAILRFISNQAESGDDGQKQQRVLEAWGDAVAAVNSVMSAANEVMADDAGLQSLPKFVLIPKDGGKYPRTFEQFNAGCKGMIMEGVCVGGN